MVHNNDGSFTVPAKAWTEEEIREVFNEVHLQEVPVGERKINLQVVCPTPEAAQKFLQEFHQMFKDGVEKLGGPVLSSFREITD